MILTIQKNDGWDNLKSKSWSSAAEKSTRLNLDRLVSQTACEEKVNRAVKSSDSGDVILAWADLASMLMKKN